MSDLPANIELGAADWIAGNDPAKTSYCSPWVLATVKHDSVVGTQGALTETATAEIVRRSVAYLSGDVDSDSP